MRLNYEWHALLMGKPYTMKMSVWKTPAWNLPDRSAWPVRKYSSMEIVCYTNCQWDIWHYTREFSGMTHEASNLITYTAG